PRKNRLDQRAGALRRLCAGAQSRPAGVALSPARACLLPALSRPRRTGRMPRAGSARADRTMKWNATAMNLKDHIRGVPDFPTPGILFYDISPLLAHPQAWQATVERL